MSSSRKEGIVFLRTRREPEVFIERAFSMKIQIWNFVSEIFIVFREKDHLLVEEKKEVAIAKSYKLCECGFSAAPPP